MNSTIVRKWTTLGVGLAMVAGILVAANSASATTCYFVSRGFIFSYNCYYGETPICYAQSAAGPVVVPCPPSTAPAPPPPKPPVVVVPPKPPVVVVPPKPTPPTPPARVATKLVLLTKAGTLSGATTVSVAAKLTDLRGNARKSTPVYLCWKAVTAPKESCAARTTNSVGVAAVAVRVSTMTTVRAQANLTATSGASRSASSVVRVTPKVGVVAGVGSLTASVNPASRVKVMLQKRVGKGYVNVRAAYTSTGGAIKFASLPKRVLYRVYAYGSGGCNAAVSGLVQVR